MKVSRASPTSLLQPISFLKPHQSYNPVKFRTKVFHEVANSYFEAAPSFIRLNRPLLTPSNLSQANRRPSRKKTMAWNPVSSIRSFRALVSQSWWHFWRSSIPATNIGTTLINTIKLATSCSIPQTIQVKTYIDASVEVGKNANILRAA